MNAATDTIVGIGVIGARSMVATRAVMPAVDRAANATLVALSALGGPVPEPWPACGDDPTADALGCTRAECV